MSTYIERCDQVVNDLAGIMKLKIRSYIKQGLIPNDSDNAGSFRTPRCAAIAAAKDAIDVYMPVDRDSKELIKNLECF